MANVAVSYKINVYNEAGEEIGMIQSLAPSQKRGATIVRELGGIREDDIFGSNILEGVAQIPKAPEYTLTIKRLALYGYVNSDDNVLSRKNPL